MAFPDFLEMMDSSYYHQCKEIKLDRQIGSRYYVTAANAGKVLFLREAALSFLVHAGKHNGNKLKQTVFEKLHDSNVIVCLKAYAIMFHHIYCN